MARIAMVVFSYYPADARVRREAEILGRAGHVVDVMCLRKPGESRVEAFGNVTAYRVMAGPENKESLFKYFFLSVLFALAAMARLASLTARGKHDLLQAHNMPDHLVFTGILHKLAGVPVVLDLHDLTVELFETRTAGQPISALLPVVKTVERLSCRFADKLITTSTGFKNRLIERGVRPEKIELVLNSADDGIFKDRPAREWTEIKEGPVLLYHGTVARRFGLHVAIEAVARLKPTFPGAKLKIFGNYDPSYKKELEGLVRELDISDAVSINGYLRIDKVSEEIAASDMGIVPYLDDPFMRLALSTKTFEYVCMGMPVVAAGLESIREVFDDESIKYFNPGDPADLCEKITEFCRRPDERRSFTERASAAYSSLSWPVMSEKYLSAINALVARRAGAP